MSDAPPMPFADYWDNFVIGTPAQDKAIEFIIDRGYNAGTMDASSLNAGGYKKIHRELSLGTIMRTNEVWNDPSDWTGLCEIIGFEATYG